MNWKYSLILFFSLFLSSCVNIKDTIIKLNVLNNTYEKIYNYVDNTASINVISYVKDTGDMQGILLYGSNSQNILDSIDKNDINNYYPNLKKKPGYLSLFNPNSINYLNENKELTRITKIKLNPLGAYHLSTTVLFRNSIASAIYNNEGYFENTHSEIITIYPKKKQSYNINNQGADPTQANLTLNNGVISLDGTGDIRLNIKLFSIGGVNYFLPILESIGPNTGIVSKGFLTQENLDIYHDMTKESYVSEVTVAEKNLYLVKYDNMGYFKIYVRSASASASTLVGTLDNYFLSIDVYYSDIPNADKF